MLTKRQTTNNNLRAQFLVKKKELQRIKAYILISLFFKLTDQLESNYMEELSLFQEDRLINSWVESALASQIRSETYQ